MTTPFAFLQVPCCLNNLIFEASQFPREENLQLTWVVSYAGKVIPRKMENVYCFESPAIKYLHFILSFHRKFPWSIIRSENEIDYFKIFIQCQLPTLKTNQQILDLSFVFVLVHIVLLIILPR